MFHTITTKQCNKGFHSSRRILQLWPRREINQFNGRLSRPALKSWSSSKFNSLRCSFKKASPSQTCTPESFGFCLEHGPVWYLKSEGTQDLNAEWQGHIFINLLGWRVLICFSGMIDLKSRRLLCSHLSVTFSCFFAFIGEWFFRYSLGLVTLSNIERPDNNKRNCSKL